MPATARMDPYSKGRDALKALAERTRDVEELNEATTRLRYINTLLSECLGWPVSEINAEDYHAGEYVDYAVGRPAVQMIVEAKREGKYFTLPAGLAGRRSIDLSTLTEDSVTRDAIDQVLRYCQSRGVPIAAICNGHQLIAFYASRQDGVPPLQGRALCFTSLSEMVDDFSTFWAHLSRDGIAQRNLQRALMGNTQRATPPPKLADGIHDYPGFRPRTELETDLKILGGIFIQDLESEREITDEFLRTCYASSGALSQYALVSKEILRARYDAIARSTDVEAQTARTRRGVNPVLSSDLMAAALSRRPLILLGDVGVGKSMFLRHLLRIDAVDVLKNSLVFYINFGKEPALETSLEEYAYRRIISQLLSEYDIDIFEARFVRATYNREINRFKRGIYGVLAEDDPAEFRRQEIRMLDELTASASGHLRRALEHIRATSGRTSILVLDNVDQRPPEFQERVFLIAQSFAETWPATVFVALRPSTFYESRSRGSLAAYQPRVFTVLPARVDQVVSRRLDFARKQLLAVKDAGTFPANLSLSATDLVEYLDTLIKAFGENEDLNSILDNLSGGNLRLALTFLSSFVGSGYVSTRRVLEVAEQGGRYTVPVHEFLRSIIYGDQSYYDPRASEVCNLFDITYDDGREHFLMSQLLAYVQRAGDTAGGDGLVPLADIYELTQALGFAQEQVGPHLARALNRRLVEAPPGKQAGGPYRITSVGSYMYRSMIRQFVYVDAMIVDTPITDVVARRELGDVHSIRERLARAERFCDYLDDQWSKFGDGPTASPFDWTAISAALRADVARVGDRVDRAEGREPRFQTLMRTSED